MNTSIAETINDCVHVLHPNSRLNYAEQRLWAAVLCLLIDDYTAVLKRIKELSAMGDVDVAYQRQLEALRREAASEWFAIICLNIDIEPHQVLRKLNKLDLEYNLQGTQFFDSYVPAAAYDSKENRRERKHLRIS